MGLLNLRQVELLTAMCCGTTCTSDLERPNQPSALVYCRRKLMTLMRCAELSWNQAAACSPMPSQEGGRLTLRVEHFAMVKDSEKAAWCQTRSAWLPSWMLTVAHRR